MVGRDGDVAALFAMDDGNRAAPVALARNTPVAQAVLGFRFACVLALQLGSDGVEGRLKIHAVQVAAVDQYAVFFVAVPFLPLVCVECAVADGNDLFFRQVVFGGKLEIAFVVRRNSHHRAVAVAPQYIVGNPHFQLVAVERIDDVAAGRHAFFLHRRHVGFGNRTGFAFGDKCLQLGFVGGCGGCQRMLGGNGDISRAHQRVGTGGINLQEFRVIAFQTLFAVV